MQSSGKRKLFSWVGMVTFFCLLAACPAPAVALDCSPLENIPVQSDGRKKPFSTFAAETLQGICGKTTYPGVDRDGGASRPRPAIETVLSMAMDPETWKGRPVILINYKPLKQSLGLSQDRKLFSLDELKDNRAFYQATQILQNAEMEAAKPSLTREQTELRSVCSRITRLESVLNGSTLALLPPAEGNAGWLTLDHAQEAFLGAKGEAVSLAAAEMSRAMKADDGKLFLVASKKLSAALAALNPVAYPPARLMKLETAYGKLHPFGWAWGLFVCASIILWLTTLWGRKKGYIVAWVFVSAGFLMMVSGFACRVWIANRAPVTNMYESILWAALGVVFFSMIMEAMYRCHYLFLSALPVAVVALILADSQPAVFDASIRPLAPVLRDNFWLATHVTSITLGYAALALALGVGHIVLIKALFKRPVTAALTQYLYRSLQIGVMLLAIGTILGGIWANAAWGRFWGWDPKETWTLIALLCYIALLHGRLAGWWQGFGLAVGSILAFQAVLMAWYGVNFILGEGLHSYGFGTGGFGYALAYVIAEAAFVAVAWKQTRTAQ